MEFNSWLDKEPFGATEVGKEIVFNIKADESAKNVILHLHKFDDYIGKFYFNDNILKIHNLSEGIYFYHFEVEYENYKKIFGKNEEDGTVKEFSYDYVNRYQLTVHKKLNVPSWYKEGIMYNIFVDRFRNGNKNGKVSNPKKNSFIYSSWYDEPMYIKDDLGKVLRWDFFGGNLKGIIEKLEYLKKLGVSIIYLNPIFLARSNHKYDTANYKEIDPMFGNEKILKELIKKANEKGINIILDGVFSHTGADSIYFNKFNTFDEVGAYQSEKSKYFSWYKFKNYPNDYECWWGIDDLPNVDENNESYKNYIIHDKDSVLNKWISFGIKGFRLDVADELPTQFIKEFKKKLKECDTDSVLVGEVWEDASNKISYGETRTYFLGEQLDSVMGYPFRDNIVDFFKKNISSKTLSNRFMTLKENYPKEVFKANLNILSSHDTTRILSEFNNNIEILKQAIFIQMTFEGIPYIYYGDEAGLFGGKDPENRKTYPWGNENKEILDFYYKTTKLRKENEILIKGDTEFLDTNDEDLFSYIRTYEDKNILVIINRSLEKKEFRYLGYSNLEDIFECQDDKDFIIKGRGFRVFNIL